MSDGSEMEHRWGSRKAIVMPVTIYRDGLPAARGRTRNIGCEGLFIEADGVSFPEHSVVELELPRAVIRFRTKRRIPGLVIHHNEQGVGVMFCSFDRHLFKELDELLAPSPPGRSDTEDEPTETA